MKKADYNTKISEIEKNILVHDHSKYITSKELNKLTAESLATRLAQEKLVTKDDIDDFVEKTDFDDKRKNICPIQDGHFRGCSRMVGGQKAPLPKIFHTYPTMMKLGTVISYIKNIQKIYESRDTPPEYC